MYKKLATVLFTCLLLLISSIPVNASSGASTDVEVEVIGGTLNIDSPAAKIDLEAITIDGETHIIEATLGTMIVSDFRGLGHGWNVTVKAEQFTSGTRALPTNSLALNGIDSITPINTSSKPPSVVPNGPINLDTGSGSAQKILSANPGSGMGKYEITFKPLTLTVNTSELFSGNYNSVITYSIVTGP